MSKRKLDSLVDRILHDNAGSISSNAGPKRIDATFGNTRTMRRIKERAGDVTVRHQGTKRAYDASVTNMQLNDLEKRRRGKR